MLLYMDGMGHYGTAEIGVKYNTVNHGAGATWEIVPEGRFGNAVKRTVVPPSDGNPPGYLGVAPFMTRGGLWTPKASGVCGFAFKIQNLEKIDGIIIRHVPIDLFAVVEANTKHVSVAITADGAFLLRGREDTIIGQEVILAQSAEAIQSNSWAYLEFRWTIHETEGRFTLRMNGTTLIDFTGNTMQQYATPSPMFTGVWTSVHLMGIPGPEVVAWMADLYLADLSKPSPADVADFLGDGVIDTIFPNGPGLAAGWTPSEATPNWDLVNDKPIPDGDLTYVSTITPGTRDCHHFEDIPANAIVLGVHYNMLVRKEDEGTVQIKPIVGQGGVQYDGPTQGVATIAYDRYLTQPYDFNPATGEPWTVAEINNGQWGILKVT